MERIIISIYFIFFTTSSLYALQESSIIASVSDFHNIDTKDFKKKKTELCFNCHVAEFNGNDSNEMWSRSKESIELSIKDLDDSRGQPDPFSKACLICHDGSEASLVMNAPISPCGIKSNSAVSANGKNHPVFMRYEDNNELHSVYNPLNGEWDDAQKVDDLLREGNVVCISCHSPHHNKKDGYLRRSSQSSALCLGCHKK